MVSTLEGCEVLSEHLKLSLHDDTRTTTWVKYYGNEYRVVLFVCFGVTLTKELSM